MSEPPSKIDNKLGSISGPLHQNEMADSDAEFFVILCYDVLLEVLQCGDRRRLVKMERVDCRFHQIIERYFGTTPFLRLYLELKPSQSGHELEATIARDRTANATSSKISLNDLAAFPPFLRFDEIQLWFLDPDSDSDDGELDNSDTPPIGEICRLFESQLPSIKPTLDDSILAIYFGVHETKPARFRNNPELIDFLRNRLLTICDNSRSYDFLIYFESDMSAAECISSILQMPQIDQCSDVMILLFFDRDDDDNQQIRLPVEAISKWLNQKWTKKGWRELYIDCDGCKVWKCVNILEMFNHLKEAFGEAKSPVQPYIFTIWDAKEADEVEEQTLTNRKTNEEFSIRKRKTPNGNGIEVKRVVKKKKDGIKKN